MEPTHDPVGTGAGVGRTGPARWAALCRDGAREAASGKAAGEAGCCRAAQPGGGQRPLVGEAAVPLRGHSSLLMSCCGFREGGGEAVTGHYTLLIAVAL